MIMDGTAPLATRRPENTADAIRQLAKGRDALDVAQFQFVGLEDICSAYGERWPQQKSRIQEVAAGYLRSRMDASDLLISAGGGFVIIFGSACGAEAEAVAGQLSHGLNEFFLGKAEHTPSPRFAAALHSVPAKALASCLGGAAIVAPQAASEPPEPSGLVDLEWRYQPVWDVRSQILSNWYVLPCSKKNQTRVPGYQFESVAIRPKQFAAIDESSICLSEQAIKELLSQEKQALIGVSIHARTLTNISARERILSLLDRLNPQLTRYRVIKIAGVAPGFPRLYLNEIVRILKKRSGHVVIGAAWDEPDMAGLLQAGPAAVGVALPASVVGPAASVAFHTLMLKLCKDVQRAHVANVRFFVEGDITCAIATKLCATGIDNLASPRIWPATGTPDAMLRWPAARLLPA